jgi:hypothetical protein
MSYRTGQLLSFVPKDVAASVRRLAASIDAEHLNTHCGMVTNSLTQNLLALEESLVALAALMETRPDLFASSQGNIADMLHLTRTLRDRCQPIDGTLP